MTSPLPKYFYMSPIVLALCYQVYLQGYKPRADGRRVARRRLHRCLATTGAARGWASRGALVEEGGQLAANG